MREVRYAVNTVSKHLLWFVFLTHISVLATGMKGMWGKKVKHASKELAERFGNNGTAKLISLSVVLSAVLTAVYGSGLLYFFYLTIKILRRLF